MRLLDSSRSREGREVMVRFSDSVNASGKQKGRQREKEKERKGEIRADLIFRE